MKNRFLKIFLIAFTMFSGIVHSQTEPNLAYLADAIKFRTATTTIRDQYVVPSNQFWVIANSTNNRLEWWDGDSWEPVSSSGGGSTPLDQTPTSGNTASALSSDGAFIEFAKYLPLLGDSNLDGDITFNENSLVNLSSVDTKLINVSSVDGDWRFGTNTFDSTGSLEFVFLNSNVTYELSISGTPTENNHLTDKEYVDNLFNGGGNGGSGNAWSDPVDSNIIPDVTVSRELGSPSNLFLNGYFSSLNSQEIISSSISSVTAIEYDPRANAPSGLNAQGGSYFDTDGRLYLHDGVALRGVAYQDELGGGGGFSLQAFQDEVYENQLPNGVYTKFVKRVTQTEYDNLSNDDVYGLNGVEYYVAPTAPSGYSIANVNDADFSNISFDVTGAEIDAGIDWSVTDGSTTLEGILRPVTTATTSFTGLDWSSLSDGTHTLTVSIINGGARGANVTATVTKGGSSLLAAPLASNANPELNTGNASAFGADEVDGTNTGLPPINANVASILEDDGYVGDYVFEVEATATTFGRARHTFTGLTSGATYEWAILYKNESANGIRVTTTNTDSVNLVYETSPGSDWYLRTGTFTTTSTTTEVGFWTYHAPTGDATIGDKNRYKFSFKAQ